MTVAIDDSERKRSAKELLQSAYNQTKALKHDVVTSKAGTDEVEFVLGEIAEKLSLVYLDI